MPVLIWTTLVYRNWPTGIRFDASAISIGAIGSARAARRTPTVNHQSRGLFTCPWPAVESVRIVTDRAELRRMKNSPSFYTFTNRWGGKAGMSHCNIGVLAAPFMRAALVIDVDTLAVTATDPPGPLLQQLQERVLLPPDPAPAQPHLGRAHPPSRSPQPGPPGRPRPPGTCPATV